MIFRLFVNSNNLFLLLNYLKRIVYLGDTMSRILTPREREVFELLIQNKSSKQIADELFISEKTVRNHISNVMQKLDVKGRAMAVIELIRMDEISL